MKVEEAKIGTRVRSLIAFSGIPKGTEGIIDEDYGAGIMVAWDGANNHSWLPEGYKQYDGVPAVASGILRDGFDKKTELHFLEVVI